MKNKVWAVMLFAFAMMFFGSSKMYAQETPITIQAITGSNGYLCGRETPVVSCQNVPANEGGSFGFELYTSGPHGPYGYLGLAGITALGSNYGLAYLSQNSQGQWTFTGSYLDGSGTFSGTFIPTFSYVYVRGTGGRGSFTGYLRYLTSATITIN